MLLNEIYYNNDDRIGVAAHTKNKLKKLLNLNSIEEKRILQRVSSMSFVQFKQLINSKRGSRGTVLSDLTLWRLWQETKNLTNPHIKTSNINHISSQSNEIPFKVLATIENYIINSLYQDAVIAIDEPSTDEQLLNELSGKITTINSTIGSNYFHTIPIFYRIENIDGELNDSFEVFTSSTKKHALVLVDSTWLLIDINTSQLIVCNSAQQIASRINRVKVDYDFSADEIFAFCQIEVDGSTLKQQEIFIGQLLNPASIRGTKAASYDTFPTKRDIFRALHTITKVEGPITISVRFTQPRNLVFVLTNLPKLIYDNLKLVNIEDKTVGYATYTQARQLLNKRIQDANTTMNYALSCAIEQPVNTNDIVKIIRRQGKLGNIPINLCIVNIEDVSDAIARVDFDDFKKCHHIFKTIEKINLPELSDSDDVYTYHEKLVDMEYNDAA